MCSFQLHLTFKDLLNNLNMFKTDVLLKRFTENNQKKYLGFGLFFTVNRTLIFFFFLQFLVPPRLVPYACCSQCRDTVGADRGHYESEELMCPPVPGAIWACTSDGP